MVVVIESMINTYYKEDVLPWLKCVERESVEKLDYLFMWERETGKSFLGST